MIVPGTSLTVCTAKLNRIMIVIIKSLKKDENGRWKIVDNGVK